MKNTTFSLLEHWYFCPHTVTLHPHISRCAAKCSNIYC